MCSVLFVLHILFSHSLLCSLLQKIFMKDINELPCLWYWDWIRTSGSPGRGLEAKMKLRWVYLCPHLHFCKVILSLLYPSWKAFAFLRMACVSVTAYHPYFFRSWDSNSSSITSPGFCASFIVVTLPPALQYIILF